MPTIKTKKEMNLPQLIEWAWENNVKDKTFCSVKDDRDVFYEVGFYDDGSFYSEDFLVSELVFTVEVEEEITEDTVISEMLTIYDEGITDLTNNRSLNDLIENNLKSAYIMNDDLRLILIWRDGKLVE